MQEWKNDLKEMSVAYVVAHEDDKVLDTGYFIEQLKKRWPEAEIHSTTRPNASPFQFETPDDFWVLGDFLGSCVWYQTTGRSNIAQFALWYRSVIPADWRLRFNDSGLYFHPIFITNETTEEQIIAAFDVPLDISKLESEST